MGTDDVKKKCVNRAKKRVQDNPQWWQDELYELARCGKLLVSTFYLPLHYSYPTLVTSVYFLESECETYLSLHTHFASCWLSEPGIV